MRIRVIALILSLSIGCTAIYQKPDAAPAPPAPATLAEALDRLHLILPAETIQEMRDGREGDMTRYHLGLGMWMRNHWGLWAEGPLYHDLSAFGLTHPDDMSAVILTSFWRQLHGQPLDLQAQAAKYSEYWRVAKGPEPRSNGACAGSIEATFFDNDTGVHMGTCCADRIVWSYHVDRGWYRPTPDEIAAWNTARAGRMYDPCKQANGAVRLPGEVLRAVASLLLVSNRVTDLQPARCGWAGRMPAGQIS